MSRNCQVLDQTEIFLVSLAVANRNFDYFGLSSLIVMKLHCDVESDKILGDSAFSKDNKEIRWRFIVDS